jgi:hypothetical protein
MAGTAKRFNTILRHELNVFAAWIPVTNTFRLGDYGLISDGVFHTMGNIAEYGVDWQTGTGPGSTLDFTSEGTRVVKFVGDAEVTALPKQPIGAKIEIEFSHADSFLLKAELGLQQMTNIAQVAHTLSLNPSWKRKYRVVSGVYSGASCTVLSTKEANSKVTLSGKADALRQLDLGALSAEIGYSSTKQLGLEIVGEQGVVGLGLFRLGFGDNVKILALDEAEQKVEIEDSASWAMDLEDDV